MGSREPGRSSNIWTFVLKERKKRAHVDVPVVPGTMCDAECILLSPFHAVCRPVLLHQITQTPVLIIVVKGDEICMQCGTHATRTWDEPAKHRAVVFTSSERECESEK